MRIVAQIPHRDIRISILSWNEKYIIEMEAGQYKQTYKISADSVDGLEDVKSLCSEELIAQTLERFAAMHHDFAKSFKRIKPQ